MPRRVTSLSFALAVVLLVTALPRSSLAWNGGENHTSSRHLVSAGGGQTDDSRVVFVPPRVVVTALAGVSDDPPISAAAPPIPEVPETSPLDLTGIRYLILTFILTLLTVKLLCVVLHHCCNRSVWRGRTPLRRDSPQLAALSDSRREDPNSRLPRYSSTAMETSSFRSFGKKESDEGMKTSTLRRGSPLVTSVLSWEDDAVADRTGDGLSSSENSICEKSSSTFLQSTTMPRNSHQRKSSSPGVSTVRRERTISLDLILWDDSVLVIDHFHVPANPSNLFARLQDRIQDASGTPKQRQQLVHCGQPVQSDNDLDRILVANEQAKRIKFFFLVRKSKCIPTCENHPGNPADCYCQICQLQMCSLCGILHFNATQHVVAELTDETGVSC